MEPTTIQPDRTALARLASRIALATSIATLITFAIAIATPPGAGPLCEGDCHTYPYHDIASRFPRDYWWMYAAMIQLLLFAALMVCLHLLAMPAKRFWSMMSL
ncbi:MAG TPA: hypothetical protein VFH43_06400, partial [Candidatus Kapabacteria bacterium]|nr:hypothetical protein [Candidatus Kapabacteria bacterium]